MREGGLDAPVRHPIGWKDEDFYDEARLDAELRRVFDVCHTCRRCYKLCDSFPRLFDLIDSAPTGELDSVKSEDFKPVIDACTLCDICFMASCPYVPPHEFNIDFPHLMLRYRAVEYRRKKPGLVERQLTETDRNGAIGCHVSALANWATATGNALTRPLMEKTAGIDRRAELPRYASKTLVSPSRARPKPNAAAPAFGKRKAVIYATCFANYNSPSIGTATEAVLAHNGVELETVHPRCCGMPQLEQGDIARVADGAHAVAAELMPWIERGYDVVALVPSCALMLKFEWPLILPDDPLVKRLSEATYDVAEYVVDIAGKEGLAPAPGPIDGSITLHIACHARAQNMGRKAAELLKLIPDANVTVIERCSGHGGAWGVRKGNFDVALKVGRPVARQAVQAKTRYLASECPLAAAHIRQGMALAEEDGGEIPATTHHPIELFAKAYGLVK
ncbi:MAG: heterodisulfide reductase-related iron-sulfur binding cluster [Alphaproteobacteria bacterium]